MGETGSSDFENIGFRVRVPCFESWVFNLVDVRWSKLLDFSEPHSPSSKMGINLTL